MYYAKQAQKQRFKLMYYNILHCLAIIPGYLPSNPDAETMCKQTEGSQAVRMSVSIRKSLIPVVAIAKSCCKIICMDRRLP